MTFQKKIFDPIAGFTLIDVKSREEAIEWALRMPDPHGFGEGEIEVRRVFDLPDPTTIPESKDVDAALRCANNMTG